MYFRFLTPILGKNSFIQRITRFQRRNLKTVQESELKNEPIKYTTSEAGLWKAMYTTSGKEYFETPRIQPFVVVMSLTAFMVYFCILREENDWDDWLRNVEKDLPLRMEEAEIRAKLERAKLANADTSIYEKKLENIMSIRKKIEILK